MTLIDTALEMHAQDPDTDCKHRHLIVQASARRVDCLICGQTWREGR